MAVAYRRGQSCVFTGIVRVPFRDNRRGFSYQDDAFRLFQFCGELWSYGNFLRHANYFRRL